MDGTDHSEELHLQRLNALCRLCGRRSNKAFDDRKIILCKTYATELSAFHQIDTSSDTASKHSETLCRPCYMRLMRLKRFKVPSDFTLQAAKEDIDKSSGIWSEFSSLISADQCSVCAQFFNQTKGGRPTKPKLGGGERSVMVSEADCDTDRSTVVEHDSSTLYFSHTGSKYVNSKKVLCTYVCSHSICFTTSTNITDKTAEHYL